SLAQARRVKFVADEGIERQIVARLRQEGHDVAYVAETSPAERDEFVLARAAQGHAVLITADKDFGELVYRLRRASSGVLLLRLAGLPNAMKAEIVAMAVSERGQDLPGGFALL